MVNLPDRKGVVLVDLNGAPYTISAGGTSMTDNAAFTPGSSSGTPAFFEVDDTGTSAASEGSAGIARMTVQRGVHVNLRDVAGAELTSFPVTNAGLTELAAAINTNRVDVNIAADGVGIGGGTEYTEDAAAAADPVGKAMILVRRDTPSATEVSADGDNVAAKGNSAGAQYIEILSGVAKIGGDAANGLDVDVTRLPALVAGTANIGDVDVLTVPADPFGANADASSATGSISAKLRFLAAGIAGATSLPAGTNNIGDVDVLSVPAPLSTTGGGTEATALRVTVASDSTGVLSVDDNGGSLTVDAPVGTPAFVRLSDGAAAITTLPVSLASVPSHAVTNAGTFATQATLQAGSALAGDVGIQGRATGGTTTFRSIDLDETEEEVKATAGTIYSIHAMNLTTGILYLKLYNLTAANTTVGTSTPTHTFPIPANADTDAAGFTFAIPQGIAFSTAISAAVTTGVADADTGAPAANAAVVHIQYV